MHMHWVCGIIHHAFSFMCSTFMVLSYVTHVTVTFNQTCIKCVWNMCLMTNTRTHVPAHVHGFIQVLIHTHIGLIWWIKTSKYIWKAYNYCTDVIMSLWRACPDGHSFTKRDYVTLQTYRRCIHWSFIYSLITTEVEYVARFLIFQVHSRHQRPSYSCLEVRRKPGIYCNMWALE